MEKVGIEKMKLEDTAKRLIMENEMLKRKDETYFNIYECLNQFLDSKGFKISKKGEIHEEIPDNDANKETQADESSVKFVCDEGDEVLNSKTELTVHKSNMHITLHSCNICDFKAESKAELMKHKDIHRQILLKCHSCKYQTESKDTLKKHIDESHESIEVLVENEPHTNV